MKTNYIHIVSYCYILLFVYAAVSKLLTFEAFQVQLTQSPLLSAFATSMAYLVVVVELLFALLLAIPKTRHLGLYLSYGLMVAFSLYIYLILHYSDFIPCSCGGILEKMGWTEHLWFNILVSVFGLLAIYLQAKNKRRFWIRALLLTMGSMAVVVVLFLSSEYIIKKENPFIRRYLPHGAVEDTLVDLGVNSFYFSGNQNDTLYLGNYTTPLRFIAMDEQLQRQDFQITIDSLTRPYTQLKFKTQYPYFYLADGIIPLVFQGRLDHPTKQKPTELVSINDAYFSDFVPLDSLGLAFKSQSSQSYQNVLGRLNLHATPRVKVVAAVLQSDADGVFDTDGILRYSKEYKQLIYTYYYKNQFILMNENLDVVRRQQTIDTTTTTAITSAHLTTGEHKMTLPIRAINAKVVVHRNLLFLVSTSMGQNESRAMWKQASIVDVYDFVRNNYVGSFYINHLGEDKLSDFLVTDRFLYGLFDKKLVRYHLARSVTHKFQ